MEYEIKPKEKLSLGLRELWQYRELFYFFTWRDIKVKYKQTLLGFAWSVLQPFAMMVIFSVFLGNALKDPSSDTPYPIFVYSGLLLWNIFSSGLSNAGNSMVTNSNIIKKIYFPRLIIPISAVLVSLFDFIMAFIVFVGLLIYYHFRINFHVEVFHLIAFLLISIVITTLATFGMGCFLAALNIKYRDFRYLIPFFIQALFFLTPIIYPVSITSHQWIRYLIAFNPMYASIEIFRHSLIHRALDYQLLLISISSTFIFFIVGLYYFRKTESYFADLA
jgi:lipopolysaccharide transport system permease protein